MGFILDTNIYVGADRDRQKVEQLKQFYDDHLSSTFLHAAVAQELLAGARDSRRARVVHRDFILPFERKRRIVVPTFGTWKRSGEIISRLVERRLLSPGAYTRSFLTDVLLAASCREFGHKLITENLADFERIRKVEQFEFLPPFPTS
ncbi:MAG TPA: PIN domain-containing protein [Longimicrobium sp.]|jgi:predicted nucleic acid-binding protein